MCVKRPFVGRMNHDAATRDARGAPDSSLGRLGSARCLKFLSRPAGVTRIMRSSDARRMGKCWVTAAPAPEVRRKINGQEYETATRESDAFDPQACRYKGWYFRGLESGRCQEVPRKVRLRNDDPRRTIISPSKEPRSSRSEGGVTATLCFIVVLNISI